MTNKKLSVTSPLKPSLHPAMPTILQLCSNMVLMDSRSKSILYTLFVHQSPVLLVKLAFDFLIKQCFCYYLQDESGHEWFIQVLYTIGPSDDANIRSKRSTVIESVLSHGKNGTNIQYLQLQRIVAQSDFNEWITVAVVVGFLLALFTVLSLVFFAARHRRRSSSFPVSGATELHRTRFSHSPTSAHQVKPNSQVQNTGSSRTICTANHSNLNKHLNLSSGTEV